MVYAIQKRVSRNPIISKTCNQEPTAGNSRNPSKTNLVNYKLENPPSDFEDDRKNQSVTHAVGVTCILVYNFYLSRRQASKLGIQQQKLERGKTLLKKSEKSDQDISTLF